MSSQRVSNSIVGVFVPGSTQRASGNKYMVREGRLELPRVTPLEPKSSASTNSATLACYSDHYMTTLNLVTSRLAD